MSDRADAITVVSAAAARGIKCQCEMGGKNPIVVLSDADLELAVESTVQGAFGSTGQRCTATSRAIVIDSVADKFLELLEALAKKVVVGDPLADGVHRAVEVHGVDRDQLAAVGAVGRRRDQERHAEAGHHAHHQRAHPQGGLPADALVQREDGVVGDPQHRCGDRSDRADAAE